MDPDLSIVLLGRSGVGKSASGNTILGSQVFESKLSFNPVTTEITERRGKVFGKQIRVIETPGILDQKDRERKLRTFCQELLQSNRAVLFLVVIRVGRFSTEDQEAVETLMRVLGPEGLRKSCLLFTGGDFLRNMTLMEFILEQDPLSDVVMKFVTAYSFHLFNNETQDQEQVKKLLLKAQYPQQRSKDPDLSIVLLGKSGVGKSASGNTILGSRVFESKLSFQPVTKEITEKTGEVFGKQIRMIDTPGILDHEDTEETLRTFCQELIKSNRPVLLLVVIRVGRFTREDQEAVETLMRVLGPEGQRKSCLLFTGGDSLRNMTLMEFILDQGPLPELVMKFSGAYHLFNNETQDQEQVRKLLLKTGYLQQQPEPVPQEERRIVLLGRPGAGKSSSRNTILGSWMFRSDCDFDSVSTECVSESGTVEGHQVTVVDTPGFTDQVLTPEQLYLEIMKTLVEAYPGPHAFVIVVRLGRLSEEDKKLFELLPKLFGPGASKYIMVLFTHGDELRGQSVEDKIRNNRCMSDLVSMCGGRYCVFDNNQKGNRQQVRNLLSKIDQMVEENRGKHYTSEMFRMAEIFMRVERMMSSLLSPRYSPVYSTRSNSSAQSNSSDRSCCLL